jgi:hypothetical protein
MPPIRRIPKNVCGLISRRAAIVCLAALSILWTRSTPPSLPHSFLRPAFHSLAHHDHRQCFDHEDSQWATAPGTPLGSPPLVTSSHTLCAADTLFEFVTEGWHYNRPPPIG